MIKGIKRNIIEGVVFFIEVCRLMVDSRSSLTLFQKTPRGREGGRIEGKEGLSRKPKQLFKNQPYSL